MKTNIWTLSKAWKCFLFICCVLLIYLLSEIKPPYKESMFQKPPGTESMFQKPPDTESLFQKPPDTESMFQKPPDTESMFQKPPDTESMFQKLPGTESMFQKPPDTESMFQKPPDIESSFQKADQGVPERLYDLRIIVIVYNRAKSLLRLLMSLNGAEYGRDKVKLEVWIDRSVGGEIDQLTLQTANNFSFRHGHYSVEIHPSHVGLMGQWVKTWKPSEKSSEIAVILEDDLTVSPHFYTYLKIVHKMYDGNPNINGYALQGSSMKHHVNDRSLLEGPKDSLVFLYPVVGSWGFSPSRTNWINFVNWCATAVHNASFKPYVPDNIATNWLKMFQMHGKADTIWTIWHMYYAWKHNEFTLYSNFRGHMGLSTNWQEKGLHFDGKAHKATNKLLTEWKPEYEQLPKHPVHLDIKGRIIHNKS